MQKRPYSYVPGPNFYGNQEPAPFELNSYTQAYPPYPNYAYLNEWPMNHGANQFPPNPSHTYQNPFQQLAKPNQPTQWPQFMPLQGQQQSLFFPQQPRPSFMSQFQGENGQLDINKMLSTVGHLANTVQQVTPVIQQVSSLMKSFKV